MKASNISINSITSLVLSTVYFKCRTTKKQTRLSNSNFWKCGNCEPQRHLLFKVRHLAFGIWGSVFFRFFVNFFNQQMSHTARLARNFTARMYMYACACMHVWWNFYNPTKASKYLSLILCFRISRKSEINVNFEL